MVKFEDETRFKRCRIVHGQSSYVSDLSTFIQILQDHS